MATRVCNYKKILGNYLLLLVHFIHDPRKTVKELFPQTWDEKHLQPIFEKKRNINLSEDKDIKEVLILHESIEKRKKEDGSLIFSTTSL